MDQVIEKTEQRLEVAKQSMVDSSKASGEYMDDSVITANIKATMLKDDFLKLVPIDVTTVNGIVKLSGTVDSEQLVGRAIGLANSQAHVKSVQNELKVKVIVPSKQ
jgi:hyperosmotically inducible protein